MMLIASALLHEALQALIRAATPLLLQIAIKGAQRLYKLLRPRLKWPFGWLEIPNRLARRIKFPNRNPPSR